jgi:hypothetical protein
LLELTTLKLSFDLLSDKKKRPMELPAVFVRRKVSGGFLNFKFAA